MACESQDSEVTSKQYNKERWTLVDDRDQWLHPWLNNNNGQQQEKEREYLIKHYIWCILMVQSQSPTWQKNEGTRYHYVLNVISHVQPDPTDSHLSWWLALGLKVRHCKSCKAVVLALLIHEFLLLFIQKRSDCVFLEIRAGCLLVWWYVEGHIITLHTVSLILLVSPSNSLQL